MFKGLRSSLVFAVATLSLVGACTDSAQLSGKNSSGIGGKGKSSKSQPNQNSDATAAQGSTTIDTINYEVAPDDVESYPYSGSVEEPQNVSGAYLIDLSCEPYLDENSGGQMVGCQTNIEESSAEFVSIESIKLRPQSGQSRRVDVANAEYSGSGLTFPISEILGEGIVIEVRAILKITNLMTGIIVEIPKTIRTKKPKSWGNDGRGGWD